MAKDSSQAKQAEIAFFNAYGASGGYDVFTPTTNERLIDTFVGLSKLPPGSRVVDIGCGSGVFTDIAKRRGYRCTGIDLSPKLIKIAQTKYPDIEFIEGDVEDLPFLGDSFDGVLLSCLVHHLPDPSRCAAEVFRVLRPGGQFVAFDPNRMNPFMYLYRDRSSPLYSSVGVTDNERPILAAEVAEVFRQAGFRVGIDYLSGLHYRYVASAKLRCLLPIYNAIDSALFTRGFLKPFRSFVLTFGTKPHTLANYRTRSAPTNTGC